MKAKNFNHNVNLNASKVNKSKDSTQLELLKTDIESKDSSIIQKIVKTEKATSLLKSNTKLIESNEISFSAVDKNTSNEHELKAENEIQLGEDFEKDQKTPPKHEGSSENNFDLVCEASFCENDGSLEKQNNLKAKNSKEIIGDSSFLKHMGKLFFFIC